MKKRLILATLLSVGVLVGCGNTNTSSETPSSSETPVSSEVVSSESSSEASSEQVSSNTSSEATTTSNWGTSEAPLTVEQAVEAMKDFADDQYSTELGYLTGKVIKKTYSDQYSNWTFELECPTGATYTSKIYGALLDSGVSEPNVGDTIVGYGYFEKYVSSSSGAVCYELAYHAATKTSPKIISVVPGEGSNDNTDTPSDTTPDVNWGTSEAPLTVEQALQNMSSASTDASTTFEAGYVTGVVSTVSYSEQYSNYTIDLVGGFQLYCATVESGVTVPVAGDTVVASGTFKKHYKTCELDKGCKVVSTTHNQAAIAASVIDGDDADASSLATVTGLETSALTGSTQEFTVTPSTGYKVASVSVNGTALEADNGTYSFVVSGTNTVKIVILDENAAAPVTETLSIIASTGTTGTDTISWTSTGFTFTNNKASSTTAIRTSDSDHFRIYAHSEVVITLTQGTKIKEVSITCTGSSYTTPLVNSATASGYTAVANGSVVTITGINTATFTIADVTAQVRINSVSITYQA